MMTLRVLLFALVSMPASRLLAMPREVTVVKPAKLEVITAGKPGGSIGLRVGEKLDVVNVVEEYVLVRYRNLSGRVLATHTNLPLEDRSAVQPAPPAAPPPPPPLAAPAPTLAVNLDGRAPSKIEQALQGKLVALAGTAVRPCPPARVAGTRFFALYFSASWCGPCKQFTPELVDAYGKIRALYPEFELVLVSADRSATDMAAYLREGKMPWPALAWESVATSSLIRYGGPGIPCLVLVDGDGRVLSDSYRRGTYVGPDTVLDDTWKILRDYRKKNPRPGA